MERLDWPMWEGRYRELMQHPLTQAGLPGWLERWSDVIKAVEDHGTRLHLLRSQDVHDPAAREASLAFVREVQGPASAWDRALERRYLEAVARHPGWDTAGLARRFAAQAREHPAGVQALEGEIEALAQHFDTVQGQLYADLAAGGHALSQIVQDLGHPDRAVREAAYHVHQQAKRIHHPAWGETFLRLLPLRHQVAQALGLPGPLAHAWQTLGRVDYGHDAVHDFRLQVQQHVVPLLGRFRAQRQTRLGVPRLRPWDLQANPFGAPPLPPYRSEAEWVTLTAGVLERLNPAWARRFADLADRGALDMADLPQKSNGMYAAYLPVGGEVRVFGRIKPTLASLTLGFHEVGHALHMSLWDQKALSWHQMPPLEFMECVAQSVELLCLEHYDLFFAPEGVRQVRHLFAERILSAVVGATLYDHFQERVYAASGLETLEQLDALFLDTARLYPNGVDWSGLEVEHRHDWPQAHLYHQPFYMIEYAFAWVSALQVRRQVRRHPQAALEALEGAMRLGYRVPLPQLFAQAGTRMVPDAAAVQALCQTLIEDTVDPLRV